MVCKLKEIIFFIFPNAVFICYFKLNLLVHRSNVNIKVFDLLGNKVKELVKGEYEAGKYNVEFKAFNLTSGVYFYGIQVGSFSEIKKMILLK
jgi:hypothetical protein